MEVASGAPGGPGRGRNPGVASGPASLAATGRGRGTLHGRAEIILGVAGFKERERVRGGERGIVPWQSSPLEAVLAGGTEAPASVIARRRALWGSEGTWGVETHTKRTFPSLIKVLPFTRIRDWPICHYSAFFLCRYAGGFREAEQIN